MKSESAAAARAEPESWPGLDTDPTSMTMFNLVYEQRSLKLKLIMITGSEFTKFRVFWVRDRGPPAGPWKYHQEHSESAVTASYLW